MDTQPLQSELDIAIDGFYAELDAGEKSTMKRLAVAHARTSAALDAELVKLEKLGAPDGSASWLQRERLSMLILQANAEYEKYGKEAGLILSKAQLDAAERAQKSLDQIMYASKPNPAKLVGGFSKLNNQAIQQITGMMADGSPLRSITDGYGEYAARQMNQVMVAGIGSGQSPLKVARDMVKAGGMTHTRAQTVARTEVMRVTREVSRRQMLANSDVVKAWRWYARCDSGCCPVCWAMHGQVFKLTTRMATHPNCRCIDLPVMYDYEELGIPGVKQVPESPLVTKPGVIRFKSLPEGMQQQILGKGAFTAYKNGLIDLPDLVGESFSPKWGYGKFQRPLKDVVGGQHSKMLSKGEVPTTFKGSRPQIKPEEAFADPMNAAKIVGDEYKAAKTLPQGVLDQFDEKLATNQFASPQDAIQFLDEAHEAGVKAMADDVWKLHNEGIIDEDLKNQLLGELDIYTADQMNELRDTLHDIEKQHWEAISKLEAQKVSKLQALDDLMLEQKQLGVISDFDYDAYKKYFTVDKVSLQDLEDAYIAQFNNLTDNHPKILGKQKYDQLLADGKVTQVDYDIAVEALDKSNDPDVLKFYNKKADSTEADWLKPTFGDIYGQEPGLAQKLDELVNAGKITNRQKNHMVKQYWDGDMTHEDFHYLVAKEDAYSIVNKSAQELLDELDGKDIGDAFKSQLGDAFQSGKISKGTLDELLQSLPDKPKAPSYNTMVKSHAPGSVTKSSIQLKNELNAIPGHGPEKLDLLQKYNAKIINKEQMQESIDKLMFDELDSLENFGVSKNTISKWKHEYNTGVKSPGDIVKTIQQEKGLPTTPTYTPPTYTPPVPKPQVPFDDGWADVELNQWGMPRARYNVGDFASGGPTGNRPAIMPGKQGVIPKAGKGPYKKNADALSSLKNRGKITQDEYDNVYDLWYQGKLKNRDIENYIADINIYDGGNAALKLSGKTADDIRNFSWDVHGWRHGGHLSSAQEWERKASAAAKASARRYTGSDYRAYNAYLRKNEVQYGHNKATLYKWSEELQESFEHAAIDRDMVLYRGTSIRDTHDWAHAVEGDLLVEHGVSSTTFTESKAWGGGYKFRIFVPKGANAVDIRTLSMHASEDEVLFPPGSIFRVVEKKPSTEYGRQWDVTLEWVGYQPERAAFRKKKGKP